MNLLPKSSSEFSQQDYWEKFFRTRGKQAFEWYGNHHQLSSILHKYINYKDNILVGGCGNSTLGADLYSAGFKNITNVDISETVIQQMTQQYAVTHPTMNFIAMDLLKMSFQKESFSCFLDKGTLDALMSDKEVDSQERAKNMFQEIDRVLKVGGRYICISLLQEHIFQQLCTYFHDLGWMIRVCRCEDAERGEEQKNTKKGKPATERFPFPVFVVVCTKFKKMERIAPILEYSADGTSIERFASLEALTTRVQSVQNFVTLCHQISNPSGSRISDDIFIELMDPKSTTKTPRFTLFVVDRNCKTSNKFAAFVVPQGREMDWLFNSHEGRRQLADNAKFQRLLVIHLGRDHRFESLDCIQNELSGVVSSLQPADLPPNTRIPFLSLGSEVSQRKEISRGMSDSTGEYIIEEVEEEDNDTTVTLRRLIFLSNPNVIQSEARILSEGKVDVNYLSCKHHSVMVQELDKHLIPHPDLRNVLVLGLGGGALCTYLNHKLPSLFVDGVEIDSEMIELAKRFFGFRPNAHLKAHVGDGLAFVKHLAASEKERYGCIMIDVDCKDRSLGISCPPPSFVEPCFISTIKACLDKNGLFLLNLVCRDAKMHDNVIKSLRESFADVLVKKIKGEVNEVIACSVISSAAKDSHKKS